MQLVRRPGGAAGVVPAGCLLLWSWGAQPAAAEHRQCCDAGRSGSKEPHHNTLCVVSLVVVGLIVKYGARVDGWTTSWRRVYCPVLLLQVWPGRCEGAAEHRCVSKGFDVDPHALWRRSSLQRGHEGVPVQRSVTITAHVFISLHKWLSSSLFHSYAEQAENPALCVTAATHFWNTCLPFMHVPEERRQLLEPLEEILLALVQTRTKHLNVWLPPHPDLSAQFTHKNVANTKGPHSIMSCSEGHILSHVLPFPQKHANLVSEWSFNTCTLYTEPGRTGRLLVLKSATWEFFGWCNGWAIHGNQWCVQFFLSWGDGNGLLVDFAACWDSICISKSVSSLIYIYIHGLKMKKDTKYASFSNNIILYFIAICTKKTKYKSQKCLILATKLKKHLWWQRWWYVVVTYHKC